MTHAKVAVGVYLAAAMLNHSCIPNALATFHGAEMRVVATRAVEKGEPVTISYGPLSSKVSEVTGVSTTLCSSQEGRDGDFVGRRLQANFSLLLCRS